MVTVSHQLLYILIKRNSSYINYKTTTWTALKISKLDAITPQSSTLCLIASEKSPSFYNILQSLSWKLSTSSEINSCILMCIVMRLSRNIWGTMILSEVLQVNRDQNILNFLKVKEALMSLMILSMEAQL